MTQTFINATEDMRWLLQTHLKEHANAPAVWKAKSAMLHGNEDCPQKIELYAKAEPRYDSKPSAAFVLDAEHHPSRYVLAT